MHHLAKSIITLIAFLSLAMSMPAVDITNYGRDVTGTEEPPCLCYTGTIAWVCGYSEDASPGHLTGTCDAGTRYLCDGAGKPTATEDCATEGLSCISNNGNDYCG